VPETSNGTFVACPAGARALGGGVLLDGKAAAGDAITRNAPIKTRGGVGLVANGARAEGWIGVARNAGDSRRTLHVYAICAPL